MHGTLIVGAGGIASRHASIIAQAPDAELAGIVDVSEDAIARFRERFPVPAATDLDQALDDLQPGAVILCTPRTVREAVIRTCCSRGIPILIEKPPCECLSTGRRIEALLHETGLVHSVGFMHRYNPAIDLLRERLQGHAVSTLAINVRTPLARMDLWKTKPYPYDTDASGSIAGEVGIHYIDLIRFISGSEAGAVVALGTHQVLQPQGRVTTCDAAAWALRMDNGVVASVIQTWTAGDWRAVVTAVTDKGTLVAGLMGGASQLSGTIDGETIDFEGGDDDEHRALHRAFFDAAASGDLSGIRSPYGDALKTFETAARVNRELYGETRELD